MKQEIEVKQTPEEKLNAFLNGESKIKIADAEYKTIAVKMHVDTLQIVCNCLKLNFANRVSEKQIAVMAFRKLIADNKAEVSKVFAEMSEGQQEQFTKDLSY